MREALILAIDKYFGVVIGFLLGFISNLIMRFLQRKRDLINSRYSFVYAPFMRWYKSISPYSPLEVTYQDIEAWFNHSAYLQFCQHIDIAPMDVINELETLSTSYFIFCRIYRFAKNDDSQLHLISSQNNVESDINELIMNPIANLCKSIEPMYHIARVKLGYERKIKKNVQR